ncbi:MAG: hypothetical protein GF364_22795 [Candidatus Lokiarchaeota archaeon]|nr:hypothetical protein [Candidatus Lokiarchaeota archaeon]
MNKTLAEIQGVQIIAGRAFVRTFTAKQVEKGPKAGMIVLNGFAGMEWVDGDSDPAQALRDYMSRKNITEIREWFEDGGAQYEARYPGRDITGAKFDEGALVLRKMRQFLAI